MIDKRLGAQWHKWDLHVHTPSSIVQHYGGDNDATWEKFIVDLENLPPEFKVLGINDYLFIDGYERLLREKNQNSRLANIDLLLPVIEFRIDKFIGVEFGPYQRVNLHVIFSEELSPDVIKNQFLSAIQTSFALNQGIPEDTWNHVINKESLIELGDAIKETIPPSKIQDFGDSLIEGFNSLSVKEDEIYKILSRPVFNGKALTAIGKAEWYSLRWTDASIATKKDIINKAGFVFSSCPDIQSYYQSISHLNREKVNGRLLDCSDAHHFSSTGDKDRIGNCYNWIKADLTFKGLLQAKKEFQNRVFVGDKPPIQIRYEQHPEVFIDSLEIRLINGENPSETWFQNQLIEFNKELVAIIGNKGQGKSALTDFIGLATRSHIQSGFSFLKNSRFLKHPDHRCYEVQVTFLNNTNTGFIPLTSKVQSSDVEKVAYLPQSYIEDICTETDTRFEDLIQDVIFSYLPDEEKLDTSDFREFLEKKNEVYRLEEAREANKLDALIAQLLELELKLRTEYKDTVVNRIRDLQEKLGALVQPDLVQNPLEHEPTKVEQNKILQLINDKNAIITTKIITTNEIKLRIKNNVSLIEKINSYLNEVKLIEQDIKDIVIKYYELLLKEDLKDLNRTLQYKVDYSFAKNYIEAINMLLVNDRVILKQLEVERNSLEVEVKSLSDSMSEPERKYLSYKNALEEYQKQKNYLEGMITNYQLDLKYLEDKLNDDIRIKHEQLIATACSIFNIRKEHLQTIINAYDPIQNCIDGWKSTIPIIAEYGLVFNTSIHVKSDFSYRFLEDFVSAGNNGSFCGKDAAIERFKDINNKDCIESEADLVSLISNIVRAIYFDFREGKNESMKDINSQFRKENSESKQYQFYQYLFGCQFLTHKTEIISNNKSIDKLSPGEKGTVLLVLYLLLDKSSVPLIIDQPEENLDNQSVYEVLRHFIMAAKRMRQVIIITHNPNIAVACDAEQIICVSIDKADKNRFSYISGSVENDEINKKVTDILEGTMPAFNNRKDKYIG